MKKAFFLVLLVPLALFNATAGANCRMMDGMGPGMMMGGGMMGGGMMGGDGMGMGAGAMGRGMQSCMLQECWQQDMHGRQGGIMPQMIVHTAFREISGYQINAAALGLNEEQLQRLGDIKENLTASMIRTHADLQIGAIDLRRAMTREMPDVAAADKIIDRQSGMWSKLQKTAIKAAAEARNILTPQQRQQAKKLAADGSMMQRPVKPEQPGTPPPDHELHH
jgi:hypothetical protein